MKNIKSRYIFILLLFIIQNQILADNDLPYNSFISVCAYCTKSIKGKYLNYDGKNYHLDCYKDNVQLRCDYCSKLISGIYNIEENNNYHSACYRENILPKCNVCEMPLDSDYIIDNWGNKYHSVHLKESANCESCSRLICDLMTNGGYQINDTRNICKICWKEVINQNTSNIDIIVSNVKSKLRKVGIDKLPDNIPITLVNNRKDLERISDIRLDEINGYTKYERKAIAGKTIWEKYEIFILSNLHEMIFKAVLAHELMHVYLFQNNITLSSQKREGFCNLGAKIIYDDYNNAFSKLKLTAMYNSEDIDYGKGFVIMDAILKRNGWDKLLSDLNK